MFRSVRLGIVYIQASSVTLHILIEHMSSLGFKCMKINVALAVPCHGNCKEA